MMGQNTDSYELLALGAWPNMSTSQTCAGGFSIQTKWPKSTKRPTHFSLHTNSSPTMPSETVP
jgi:hypothetical protein